MNKLRKAINKANPWLLKLEHGCEIEYCNKKAIVCKKIDDLHIFTCPNGFMVPIKEIKILGKDPTLANVLVAIYCVAGQRDIGVNRSGCFTEDDIVELDAHWVCVNDSLSWHEKNRPETIEYLTKLLT